MKKNPISENEMKKNPISEKRKERNLYSFSWIYTGTVHIYTSGHLGSHVCGGHGMSECAPTSAMTCEPGMHTYTGEQGHQHYKAMPMMSMMPMTSTSVI